MPELTQDLILPSGQGGFHEHVSLAGPTTKLLELANLAKLVNILQMDADVTRAFKALFQTKKQQ